MIIKSANIICCWDNIFIECGWDVSETLLITSELKSNSLDLNVSILQCSQVSVSLSKQLQENFLVIEGRKWRVELKDVF